jgi:hypothetical protein
MLVQPSQRGFTPNTMPPTQEDILWQRINNLEKRLKEQENMMKRAIKAIGENMSEDFDFDDLLSEIDEVAEVAEVAEVTEVVEVKAEKDTDELVDSTTVDDIIDILDTDSIDDDDIDISDDVLSEVIDEALDEVISETETVDISAAAEEVISSLEKQVTDLKGQLKSLKKLQNEAQTAKVEEGIVSALPEMEYSAEAKSFLREYNSIEFEKRGLQEKMKALKTDYKDQGVDTSAVLKSQNEIIKELKETTEEAQLIEQMKELIKGDDNLMVDANMLSQ